jgi:hypothetical protein
VLERSLGQVGRSLETLTMVVGISLGPFGDHSLRCGGSPHGASRVRAIVDTTTVDGRGPWSLWE